MDAQVVVTGVGEVIRAMEGQKGLIASAMAGGLERCADETLVLSGFYVPKDTGALFRSGRKVVSGRGVNASARVLYGGMDDPGNNNAYYALYVHEDMTKNHDYPTCAKFLERATRELSDRYTQIMMQDTFEVKVASKDGHAVPAFLF